MASNQDDDPNELSPPTVWVDEFLRVAAEGHPENPFRKGPIQRRNELMFRLLYETGIRIGELLSIRLDHIETGHEPTIKVRRTHGDPYDPRAYQPVAKTKERTLAISDEVATKLVDYYMNDRAATPGATQHPYLFVTHRRGQTCGQPLSMSAASNRVFGAMQAVRPEFSGFHAHSFRHHLNYLLSKAVDKHNRRARRRKKQSVNGISSGREAGIRAHLNGHRSIQSGKAYDARHVRETTNRVMVALHEEDTDAAKRTSSEHDEIAAISPEHELAVRAYMNGHRRSDSSNDYNHRALQERTNKRVLELQRTQTEAAKRGGAGDE